MKNYTIDEILSSKEFELAVFYSNHNPVKNKELKQKLDEALRQIVECYVGSKDYVFSFGFCRLAPNEFTVAYNQIYDALIEIDLKIAKNTEKLDELTDSHLFNINTKLGSYYITIHSDISPFTKELALKLAKLIENKPGEQNV
ncbi:hypothetical protein GZ989_011300 (plasmid) [Campylobacter fetus]|uniref:Uncharacterized protein n=1 Tax=Campylobacter fetus TaxID=196 RepID=A0A974RKR1_CAMFE|nr:hypothetical protein [Campylobacter fetus]OCS32891.1 hypothetical protein AWR31_08095 [Campylobacter fetus subsp. venerealis]QMS59892.1 hypothetical protein GZ989_011300 [Campylobacter fetus]